MPSHNGTIFFGGWGRDIATFWGWVHSVSFGRWVEKSRCSELGAVTWRWERNLERWGYWNALLSSSLKRNYVIYSLAKEFWMKSQERQSRAGSVGYVEDSELWKPLSVNSASPFPLCYPWPSAHDWNLLEHIYLFERVIQTQERERRGLPSTDSCHRWPPGPVSAKALMRVAEVKTLWPTYAIFPIFPRLFSVNWVSSRTARTQIGARMGCWRSRFNFTYTGPEFLI